MWEQFADAKGKGRKNKGKGKGVLDLRIDLQPPRRAGHTDHYGSPEWANWAVQYGANVNCGKSSRATKGLDARGAFAGVFMETDASFR